MVTFVAGMRVPAQQLSQVRCRHDFFMTQGHQPGSLPASPEPRSLLVVYENHSPTPLQMTMASSGTTASSARLLPTNLLYSIFARIGGHGLDTDSFEALRAAYRGRFLGKAIAYDNRQSEIPANLIHSLRWHPVRLLSFVGNPHYYAVKKRYLDWVTT